MNETSSPVATVIDRDELIAHASLTAILEPGDRLNQMIVQALGARRAAEALRLEWGDLDFADRQAIDGLFHDLDEPCDDVRMRNFWDGLQQIALMTNGEQLLDTIEARGGELLVPSDPRWPAGLNDLGWDAPLALWVLGDVRLLSTRSLAVIGSRDSTQYGQRTTHLMAKEAALSGITVVSGGSYGADAAAHRAALTVVNNPTVAVASGGLDRFYPAGNDGLLKTVAEVGAVVSELAPGRGPTRSRFLARNRLIAALSDAVLVTEARERSGSTYTVQYAIALGRPVGAVPGPITSQQSLGPNELIRSGSATAINTPQQAVELVPRTHQGHDRHTAGRTGPHPRLRLP